MIKLGIIGGSGLDDPNILQDYKEVEVETPYGKPSSLITTGTISGVEVCILARHGKKHTITPTNINNKANIYALAKLGCKYIISTSAVGSLREDIKPGDIVILDQFIDFTKKRDLTFYDDFEKGIIHESLADPFSKELREKLIDSCIELSYNYHSQGTLITIEGPRFSTRAESNLFKSWGADVIGMTVSPEAILSKEAGVKYATLSMATDYDCWKEDEIVSTEQVFRVMRENSERVKKVILRTIEKFSEESILEANRIMIKNSIRAIENYPKPGITFRDITTLMKNTEAMKKVIEIFYERYKGQEIDVVAGIESRGFIFGAILSEKLGCKFVPIRKKGKLPAETISQEYDLEYGKDIIEIHKDSINPKDKVLIIDDLLATGGTALASCKLIEKLQGKIQEVAFVISLSELNGKKKLLESGYSVFNIIDL